MDRRKFLESSLLATLALSLPARRLIAADTTSTLALPAEIPAITGAGAPTTLARSDLQALKDSLRGAVLLPGNPGYDEARRVQNKTIDRHPALVVLPSGAADVRTAVTFAREHSLLLAVKCGGHSQTGQSTCDGGMQLDLSRLRGVRIDSRARRAYVAGGCLLGDLDHEAMACGLVTTAGTVSHTGVGGLTLGGGFGRLARRLGLALDNVTAVDIVTADGEYRHASSAENPELLWAVRGGGGNFGVVTMFEFALHPMQREVVGGHVVFPLSRARELLPAYADLSLHAPDELYTDCIMRAAPGEDAVFIIAVCYSGAAGRAEQALAPIRKLGTPLADTLKAQDYVAIQRGTDRTDPRVFVEYEQSGLIDALDSDLADTVVAGFEPSADRRTAVFFQHGGGAIGRVPATATAFPHRRATHNMIVATWWPVGNDPTPHRRYLDRYWAALRRFTDGVYVNSMNDEPADFVEANYQGNLQRLRRLKQKYDPTNLFRLNANIRPTV